MLGSIIARIKVASAYEALNRKDMAGFLAGWSEDGVFVFPGDISISGTHKGRAAIEQVFQVMFQQFSSIHFTLADICIANCFDMLGNNTMAVHWEVRLANNAGYDYQNSGVTYIRLRLGKVIYAKDILFDTGINFRTAWAKP